MARPAAETVAQPPTWPAAGRDAALAPQVLVEVERCGLVESRHLGVVAVCDADGALVAAVGDPDLVVYARSAVKPFQALAVRALGVEERLGLGASALASASGSHRGEPVHVDTVRATLAAAGLTEDDLRCPPALPRNADARAAAPGRRRVFHNCSGKHAYLLAGAVARGWPTGGYPDPDHPLQQAVRATIETWAGTRVTHLGTDGCSAPAAALPLRALAAAFARLAVAATDPDAAGGGPAALVAALRAEPVLLNGTGAADTRIIEVTGGRIVAKRGAEAVAGAANLATGEGLFLKVLDGGSRATSRALLAVLRARGWLREEESTVLAAELTPKPHAPDTPLESTPHPVTPERLTWR